MKPKSFKTCFVFETQDEADVLGDQVGIMNRGVLQCCGSPRQLKRQFGSGYKVYLSMQHGALSQAGEKGMAMTNLASAALVHHPLVSDLVEFAAELVPGASLGLSESSAASVCLVLPFVSSQYFASFFNALDERKESFLVASYGIQDTSLEEVCKGGLQVVFRHSFH